MSAGLLVAEPGLELPEDAVTSTFALLGQTGSGKSNAGVVMAEGYFHAGKPWVAIDPKGDWWGITLDRDGTGPGLPVPVVGGQHGDVPLDPTAGRALARLVADGRLTVIIDTSELEDQEAVDFLIDFFTELYRANRRPLHVFMEEASEYLPQVLPSNVQRASTLVSKAVRILKMGRGHGLGVTILDQRSSAVSKAALSQVKTVVALLNTLPLDVKTIKAVLDGYPESAEAVSTLRELAPGEAWVYSPSFLAQRGAPPLRRVRFARRQTFDSGATPTDAGPPPDANRARADLATLTSTLAQAVERAAEDDPDALRHRLALAEARERSLAREVASLRGRPVDGVDRETMLKLRQQVVDWNKALLDMVERFRGEVLGHRMVLQDLVTAPLVGGKPEPSETPIYHSGPSGQVSIEGTLEGLGEEMEREAGPASPEAHTRVARQWGGEQKLPKAERSILTALAQHGPCNRQRLGILAGYSARGGSFGNALGALRTKGYITREPRGDVSEITDEGLAALGQYEPLPTGPALVEWWMTKGGLSKAEREILGVLTARGLRRLTREQIAAETPSQYEPRGGSFGNALGRLRTRGLIEGRPDMAASPELLRSR